MAGDINAVGFESMDTEKLGTRAELSRADQSPYRNMSILILFDSKLG
jgi:hypothetical protein